jgi:hypothetical protein
MIEQQDPHVLIVSTKLDISTDAIVRALASRGVGCTRLNTEDLPFDMELTTRVENQRFSTRITGKEGCASPALLDDVTSIWYRRVRVPARPEEMGAGVYDFCVRESRSALMGMLLARPERVMSQPANIWRSEHKLLQLVVAREAGLIVPDTVFTNDPGEVRAAFSRFDGQMIAKPVRTGFVDYGEEQHAVFTTRILAEHLDQVESARWSPAIYQPLITKRCDVRVTAVGDDLFVAEIDSQSDPAATIDWRRTQDPHLPHRRADLPTEVRNGVRRLLDGLGLMYGALDFVRTPDDQYVFLEVNPNGQWLWLDDILGFDITGSIVRWLLLGKDRERATS